MNYLLCRFGGIGDTAPVSAVGRYLASRGHSVSLALRNDGHAKQTDLYQTDKAFSNLIDMEDHGPWRTRVVQNHGDRLAYQTLFPHFDRVVDYMNSIENNNTSPYVDTASPWEFWQRSRNSNWVNWYDLSFAWANVDPTSVPDDAKRPKYYLSNDEKRGAREFAKGFSKVFVINAFSSSLARSWYQARKMPELLQKKYPGCAVVFWNPHQKVYELVSEDGVKQCPHFHESPLRSTMALIDACDLFIGVDTGFSHVAEGLSKKHISIYSTVPWWTRAKYYRHQIVVDKGKGNPDFYTFSLGLGDPLRAKECMDGLGDREKRVKDYHDSGVPIQRAAELLNTTPEGVDMEFKALKAKVESFDRQQSKSLSSVSVEEVMSIVEREVK